MQALKPVTANQVITILGINLALSVISLFVTVRMANGAPAATPVEPSQRISAVAEKEPSEVIDFTVRLENADVGFRLQRCNECGQKVNGGQE